MIAKNTAIEFIYEKENNEELSTLSPTDLSKRMALLPRELCDNLLAALQIGHTRKINDSVDEIARHDPELFPLLKEMAGAFNYPALLDLFAPE